MTCRENYPAHLVVLNLVALAASAVVGIMLTARLGWWALAGYALLGALGVLLSLAWACTRCHYYGKICGLALGKLAALGLPKRDEREFGQGWSQTLAWSLVGLALALPLVAGIVSLSASWTLSAVAPTLVYLVLVVLIALTHSSLICGRCCMAQQGRCRLGRVAGPTKIVVSEVEAHR